VCYLVKESILDQSTIINGRQTFNMCSLPTLSLENFFGTRATNGETEIAKWKSVWRRTKSNFDCSLSNAFPKASRTFNPRTAARLKACRHLIAIKCEKWDALDQSLCKFPSILRKGGVVLGQWLSVESAEWSDLRRTWQNHATANARSSMLTRIDW
jgi:hypothetical protein